MIETDLDKIKLYRSPTYKVLILALRESVFSWFTDFNF